jgi:zinc/manganese transport system permease protein
VIEFLVSPFIEFSFMRRALVGALALSLSAPPIGVFLTLRRMSLMSDAMSHAILPGAAIGFLVSGLSVPAMTFGGLAAGLAVALLAGFVARRTVIKEDASLAAFYLMSLAGGVLLVSLRGSNVDLLHILFGTVLALDDAALILIGGVDPLVLRLASRMSPVVHLSFLCVVVLNLVAGFQALGTLLSVGLMLLPAVAARFWTEDVSGLIGAAIGIAALSSVVGLLVSYHDEVPSGPAIILTAGAIYILSMLFGPRGGFARRLIPKRHLRA